MSLSMAVLCQQAVVGATMARPDLAWPRLSATAGPSVSLTRPGSSWKAVWAAKRPATRRSWDENDDDEPPTRPSWRHLKPMEERHNFRVEKNISDDRADELGVWRWSIWETGPCAYSWKWRVDQEIYIVKGAVMVVPEESEGSAWFYAGDFVRIPKWFSGHLSFQGPYEERYRFRAYGDD